jgi:type IV pilus assembly protein PilE
MNQPALTTQWPRRRMAGVTLIELMAVVVVIGVLGMIALPSYREYIVRAQRTEAKSALLRLATNQERFYLANRTYGTDADFEDLGFPASGETEKGTYVLSITGADANGYTATATPQAGGTIDMTTDVRCTTFSLTAQGVRTATGTDAANCW